MCALLDEQSCLLQLNGVRMRAVKTDQHGVVNKDTQFLFSLDRDVVTAEYSGGSVVQGFLVGRCCGSSLEFSYCQMHDNGNVTGGRAHAEIATTADGRLRMVEHFTFDDGSSGVNILEQV